MRTPSLPEPESLDDRVWMLERKLDVFAQLCLPELGRLKTRCERLEAALREALVLVSVTQGESAANGERLDALDQELARFRLPPS